MPVTSVWTVALYLMCLLPEKMVSNCLKCTMVSTSMNQSCEKIQSLSEQSFKKGRGASCADLRFSTHNDKSSDIILHLHDKDTE